MVTRIYSVAGLLPRTTPAGRRSGPSARRTTRSRRQGWSAADGSRGPGEISLAHRGVLFLDELPEFGQQTLEVLRQPLEDHVVTISRAQGSVTYPANFMLVAAMNPCPCGNYGDPVKACSLLRVGRVALPAPHLGAAAGPHRHLRRGAAHRVRQAVVAGAGGVVLRRSGSGSTRRGVCSWSASRTGQPWPTPTCRRRTCASSASHASMTERAAFLQMATTQLSLSARAFHRILKVARTIADLAGAETMSSVHVAEAVQYRQRSRAV